MTSQIELIKAHVLNRLADAAASFAQMMIDSGTGLKEFESAMFGMLLQVGLQLLKKFGQMQTVTSLRSLLSTQASVSLSMPNFASLSAAVTRPASLSPS